MPEHAFALGCCPARLLWGEALIEETSLARRSPLTARPGDLDGYVRAVGCLHGVLQNVRHVSPLWRVEAQCDYTPVGGEQCHDGIVQVLVGYMAEDGQPQPRYQDWPCPACQLSKYLGPGTHVTGPGPTQDTPDTHNPLGFVPMPVDALQNARETQAEARRATLLARLGADGELTTAQPRNEKDVQAGFESRQDGLVRVEKHFEAAEQWVLHTTGLRYGAGVFWGVGACA